jgi:hypothetical protein
MAYDKELTCPFCDYMAGTGAEIVDHLLKADHEVSAQLRKRMGENHNLYNEMVKDMESSRDRGEDEWHPNSVESEGLAKELTGIALATIRDKCMDVTDLLAKAEYPADRMSRCAVYMVGLMGLRHSGAPGKHLRSCWSA